MRFDTVRKFALSLPEVTEAPHHDFGSFRVRGKIFVTIPPGERHIHVFVDETQREQAILMYSPFAERLMWGGKPVGLRITLAAAKADVVERLVRSAWENKAPKALRSKSRPE
jgi:hypothetical protein